MKLLSGIGGLLFGGGVAGALGLGGSKPQPVTALPNPTRDDAVAITQRDEARLRRKGAAADMLLNGSSGAEATGRMGRLVIGS